MQAITMQVTTTNVASRRTSRTSTLDLVATLVALALATLLLTGCGGTPQTSDDTTSGPGSRDTAADEVVTTDADHPQPTQQDVPPVPDHVPAQVVRTTDHLDVHEAPGSGTVTHTLEPTTDFDSPRVLLVVDSQDEWLEIVLPVRPNGTTGWIHSEDVEVSEVDVAVEVDLDARELTVREAGEVVLTTEVAIGDPEHPTPTGTFSLTDKLDTGDPDGAYGPYAFGLSARSEVLTEFAGGDGQVGIHGTNDPTSIGQAVSHGCIRVPNEVAAQLIDLLPLGTPVTVS